MLLSSQGYYRRRRAQLHRREERGKKKLSKMPRASARERFAQVRALREAGKKVSDTYKVGEVEDLYEEVDENQYKKIVRDRLNRDDFVVDDNGEGYADDGREEWDREPVYESESDDAMVGRGKERKCTAPRTPGMTSCRVRSLTPPSSRSQEAARRRAGETRRQ